MHIAPLHIHNRHAHMFSVAQHSPEQHKKCENIFNLLETGVGANVSKSTKVYCLMLVFMLDKVRGNFFRVGKLTNME